MTEAFIHPSSVVEDGAFVGAGSTVWHLSQVRAGARIGERCIVGRGVYVGAGVTVGDRCKIQNHAMLFEGCEIADGVFIGPGAQLANDRLPRAITPEGELKSAADWTLGRVQVEEGASIGAGAIIVPDTRVGRWAMVGAGSVVTRDVGEHELVVGNPARHVGRVCSCARRLEREGDGDVWRCVGCGRTFELKSNR